MMLNNVKLANGTEVTWEEFSKWGAKKQSANLNPTRTGCKLPKESRIKISKSLLGRIGGRKGQKCTEEHKAKLSRAKTRKLMTPQGLFDSRKIFIKHLAKQRGIAECTASDYLRLYKKQKPSEYYYVE